MEIKPPAPANPIAATRPTSHAALVAVAKVRIKVPLVVENGNNEAKYHEKMAVAVLHDYNFGTGTVEVNVDQETADTLLAVNPRTKEPIYKDVAKVG